MIELDGIQLPEFVWLNRLGYSPFISRSEYSLDGSLNVEVSSRQAGQPIVLFSEGEDFTKYQAIENHANTKGAASFSLNINGTAYLVMWDYRDTPITGTPEIIYSDGEPDAVSAITLKLITV